MKVSFIIPNYNGERLLKSNLPKVLEIASDYKDLEIILIDDASKDTSLEVISNILHSDLVSKIDFHLIKNRFNLGFAPSVNKAVRSSSGEIIILLNTDVIPEKNFLKYLLPHFAQEEVFAVGCLEENETKDGKKLYGRGLGKWSKGLLIHQAGEARSGKTLWVSCGSGAFRRKLWDKLGGLEEMYAPFYWEDIDLSYRAQKSGYLTLFEPRSVVRHEHEIGSIKTSYSKFNIKSIAYRNQILFSWNNLTEPLLLRQHFINLPLYLTKAIVRGDFAFLVGLFGALLKLPNVFRHRKKVIKDFIKSDLQVMLDLES